MNLNFHFHSDTSNWKHNSLIRQSLGLNKNLRNSKWASYSISIKSLNETFFQLWSQRNCQTILNRTHLLRLLDIIYRLNKLFYNALSDYTDLILGLVQINSPRNITLPKQKTCLFEINYYKTVPVLQDNFFNVLSYKTIISVLNS